RRAAFKELHRINRSLAAQHADALRDAERGVARAETGLRNAAIARKRDWCFALYPPDRLHALRRAIEAQLHSPPTRPSPPDPASGGRESEKGAGAPRGNAIGRSNRPVE